jgi:hypothetical protein
MGREFERGLLLEKNQNNMWPRIRRVATKVVPNVVSGVLVQLILVLFGLN